MQTIKPDLGDLPYVIGPYKEPIASVRAGETFRVETLDAFGDRVDSPDVDLAKVVQVPYVNPCTGPIYVEGAEPGDTLTVRVDDIALPRDYAVSAIIPDFGGVCGTVLTRVLNAPLEQRLLLHPITAEGIVHDPALNIPPIPIEAFYGTIGTAPAVEAVSTLSAGFHGGNLDAADVCPGNVVMLPVQVPGALLFIGDGHAAQGDAEICGVAAETPTVGTLTVDVVKGRAIPDAAHRERRIHHVGRQRAAIGGRGAGRLLRPGYVGRGGLRGRPLRRVSVGVAGGQGAPGERGGRALLHRRQVPQALPAAGIGGARFPLSRE